MQPGDVLDGKYRVERVLGRGGMGLVLRARHVHLGEPVAVKLLLPAISAREDARARFVREGRAAARIRSEHVARVYDAGALPSGALYLVLELLHGRDLRAEVADRGPLPVGEAIGYVVQACEGLAAAHAIGVVHRDLKPANLFLSERPDGSSSVKIIDFGVSKILVRDPDDTAPVSLTGTDMAIGTPHYMAPEQMRGARGVDARADVFSLGATLFGLLTSAAPFPGDTMVAVYDRILAGPPSARARRPEVPAELDAVIARCLEADPDARHPDVGALSRALAPFGDPSLSLAVERAVRALSPRSPETSTSEDGTAEEDTGPPAGAVPETGTLPPRDLTWLSATRETGSLDDAPDAAASTDTEPPSTEVDPPAPPSQATSTPPPPRRRPWRAASVSMGPLLLGAAVLSVGAIGVALRPAPDSHSGAVTGDTPPDSPSGTVAGATPSGPPAAKSSPPDLPTGPATASSAPGAAVSNTQSTITTGSPRAPASARPRTGDPAARPAAPTATATAAPKPWTPGPMDLPD